MVKIHKKDKCAKEKLSLTPLPNLIAVVYAVFLRLSNDFGKVLKNKEHIDYVAFIEHWYPNSIVGRYTFTEIGEDGTLLCMDMETYALVQFKPDYVLCSNLAEGDEIVVWKILLDANLKENSQSETKIIYCVTK